MERFTDAFVVLTIFAAFFVRSSLQQCDPNCGASGCGPYPGGCLAGPCLNGYIFNPATHACDAPATTAAATTAAADTTTVAQAATTTTAAADAAATTTSSQNLAQSGTAVTTGNANAQQNTVASGSNTATAGANDATNAGGATNAQTNTVVNAVTTDNPTVPTTAGPLTLSPGQVVIVTLVPALIGGGLIGISCLCLLFILSKTRSKRSPTSAAFSAVVSSAPPPARSGLPTQADYVTVGLDMPSSQYMYGRSPMLRGPTSGANYGFYEPAGKRLWR